MTKGLPPPTWPIIDDDKKPTNPWYSYLTDADAAWRVGVTIVSSTQNGALISNSGITRIRFSSNTTHFLAAPEAGCQKVVWVAPVSTGMRLVTTSTGITITQGSTTVPSGWVLTFSSSLPNKSVTMVGVDSTQYLVTSMNPAAAVTVTTT